MGSVNAIDIGLCIAFSSIGRIPAVKLIVQAIIGG